MEILIQIVGWVGTFLIVSAYFLLVMFKKIDENSKIYQVMNLFGAIGVGMNVFYHQAWPVVVLQVVWGIIAIVALIKNIVPRGKPQGNERIRSAYSPARDYTHL